MLPSTTAPRRLRPHALRQQLRHVRTSDRINVERPLNFEAKIKGSVSQKTSLFFFKAAQNTQIIRFSSIDGFNLITTLDCTRTGSEHRRSEAYFETRR